MKRNLRLETKISLRSKRKKPKLKKKNKRRRMTSIMLCNLSSNTTKIGKSKLKIFINRLLIE
jgi:hypothetical protein